MIYLVRHGQTEFNLAHRFQGACDSPLTALGEAQARAMGRRLGELLAPGTPIVTSPLGRARATAELLREAGGFRCEIAADPRLAEISMGCWDGLTRPQIEALGPGFSFETAPADWYMRAPDGEDYAAISVRVGAFLEEHRGRTAPLIAVAHGVSGRVLRGLYLGLGVDDAMRLPVPQDAFFRLSDGGIERIDCATLPSQVPQA